MLTVAVAQLFSGGVAIRYVYTSTFVEDDGWVEVKMNPNMAKYLLSRRFAHETRCKATAIVHSSCTMAVISIVSWSYSCR